MEALRTELESERTEWACTELELQREVERLRATLAQYEKGASRLKQRASQVCRMRAGVWPSQHCCINTIPLHAVRAHPGYLKERVVLDGFSSCMENGLIFVFASDGLGGCNGDPFGPREHESWLLHIHLPKSGDAHSKWHNNTDMSIDCVKLRPVDKSCRTVSVHVLFHAQLRTAVPHYSVQRGVCVCVCE